MAPGFKRDTSRIQFDGTCAAAEKIGFVRDNHIHLVYERQHGGLDVMSEKGEDRRGPSSPILAFLAFLA